MLNRLGDSPAEKEFVANCLEILGMTAGVKDKSYDRGEHIATVCFMNPLRMLLN